MSHLRLRAVDAPWGDYGHILYHGMSMHSPRIDGKICLERTGPEIFPITFPIDVIVTEQFRQMFTGSGLRGVEFRPVIKHHIVELDWDLWDTTEDEPPEYPESGEPEDYILNRPHSPGAAREMPALFELLPSKSPSDVYHLPGTTIVAVSPKARDWFQAHYADFISVIQVGD